MSNYTISYVEENKPSIEELNKLINDIKREEEELANFLTARRLSRITNKRKNK